MPKYLQSFCIRQYIQLSGGMSKESFALFRLRVIGESITINQRFKLRSEENNDEYHTTAMKIYI